MNEFYLIYYGLLIDITRLKCIIKRKEGLDNMKNYTVLQEQYLEDFKINAKLLKHNKSGARVVLMPCDDSNKVFSIAFKTAPIDNAGISHILEHSVLCGSDKYPLKEPFVELLKGSLNTFLNAFTFSDKTMYPVASKNDKDFKNLMSVYMDAVLHPQIYNHKEIFLQEGWRYEINSHDEPITINGVVYNEMKGAFSSADECLSNVISESLYPDNCYGFVSGGDPKYIPSLSYEKFLDFHKKLYHPSNSYIFLYGDADMDERLEWLDKEYLSKYDTLEIISKIDYQKPFSHPQETEAYYPIGKDEDDSNKYYYSYNVCYKDTLDAKTTIAVETLVNVLFNMPGAPVKEAIIKQNLGTEVYASYRSDYFQPMINIVVKGAAKDAKDRFISTIESTLKLIVENGIDKDTVISSLNFSDFKTREAKYQMPKGLIYGINIMTSWLYDDNLPFLYGDTLKYYKELKEDATNGYFEKLIQDAILNNNHKSYVTLIPSKTYQKEQTKKLEEKLAAYKASLSEQEIDILIENNKKLKEYQQTLDTEEVLNTLPKLELSNINRDPDRLKIDETSISNIKYYYSNYNTNGIMYINYLFDVTNTSNEEAYYMSLLVDLFGYMSTAKYSYKDITNESNKYTGELSFRLEPVAVMDGSYKLYFTTKFSCLKENLDKANKLVAEIIKNTKLDDKLRLKEILNELKGDLESSIVDRGNVFAVRRAKASFNKLGLLDEITSGISFYNFIADIVCNFDEKIDEVISKLKTISTKLFSKENMIIHLVGDESLNEAIKKSNLIKEFEEKSKLDKEFIFESLKDKIAFQAPIDVNYVAYVGNIGKENVNGSANVIKNVISNSYLWQEVRIKGGAYGCFMNVDRLGNYSFASYRDGNIKQTLEAYKNTLKFLEEYNPSASEFTKVKIGAIGSIDDAPHVEVLGSRALYMKLSKVIYEDQKQSRHQLLDASLDDFKKFKIALKNSFKDAKFIVIGSDKLIEKDKDLFDEVENIIKEK